MASGVVGAIDPKLLEAEMARVKRKAPANYDAYDCFLRAYGPSSISGQLRAVNRRSAYSTRPSSWIPTSGKLTRSQPCATVGRKVDGLATDPDNERCETERLAREAIPAG